MWALIASKVLVVVGDPACGYNGKTKILEIVFSLKIFRAFFIDGLPYLIPNSIVKFGSCFSRRVVSSFTIDLEIESKGDPSFVQIAL